MVAQPASVAKLMFTDALFESDTGSILIKPLDVLGLFYSLSESGEKTHIWLLKIWVWLEEEHRHVASSKIEKSTRLFSISR